MNNVINKNILPDQSIMSQINYKLADISEQLKSGKIKLEKICFSIAAKDKDIIDIYLSNKNIIERLKNYIWGIQDCEIKLIHGFYPKEKFFDGTESEERIEIGIIIAPVERRIEND